VVAERDGLVLWVQSRQVVEGVGVVDHPAGYTTSKSTKDPSRLSFVSLVERAIDLAADAALWIERSP
jgi:hypothetical protein